MKNFILRGNRVLIDKPAKKEEENKLDLILSESDEKDLEKDLEDLKKEDLKKEDLIKELEG